MVTVFGRYAAGRLLQFSFVIAGAMLVVFAALKIAVDPAATMLPIGTPDDLVEQFRDQHGLNDPLWEQLGSFFSNAIRGDFGNSIWLGSDAFSAALERLPATLMLTVPPVLGGGLAGVALAALTARRPSSALAQLANAWSYFLMSLAEFWVAILLILVFAVHFGLLPTSGYSPKPQVLILPWIVLSLRPFAQNYQLAQSTMSAEYHKQYVRAARARGLGERAIAVRHVLKNVAVPTVTLLCYEQSRVFVGAAIVVETIFGWPGIGRLAVDGLQHGDLFLVEAIVLLSAIATALLNLTADLFYFVVDPRTRHLVRGREA